MDPTASNAPSALLTVARMRAADAAAIAGGVPGIVLMENAGRAVAGEVMARWGVRPVAVLCGPGNNGGDGFVAARLLAAAGWPVRLALLGDLDRLTGDAALAAAAWVEIWGRDAVLPAEPGVMAGAGIVIDALFGAGLTRPLAGLAADLVAAMAEARGRGAVVVAVDVPSGLDGDTGCSVGDVMVRADVTVTFFREKPGHLLLPGRVACGATVVADIGIPDSVLSTPAVAPDAWRNAPALFAARMPHPRIDDHKYRRGHALVLGGAIMTGAARLAARAAQRVGAGLVTVVSPPAAELVYRLSSPSQIVRPMAGGEDAEAILADPRITAAVLGPGAGTGGAEQALLRALAAVAGRRGADFGLVLDADIFTAFAGQADVLRDHLGGRAVLTPHEGEFARLFGAGHAVLGGDKLTRARAAARHLRAVVLLKGPDTVIVHPDGRAVIEAGGPPSLATAGSGDVLAGLCLGLLAAGMDAFPAAQAAAWLHAQAAVRFGPGLVAEDLAEQVPALLMALSSPA
ncbi:bifunctional ADP-dependent NAD(P)H-hydrate dehydratase/NAD(P)H-hydrate epimerase [Azospirillum sp. B4]|uniref:bifunctional ADP-dependent NAD(P)H-hydrate dehydratase/NAD(P)H-hydrate epimerase n=1 Tax=Azospirillum sp. B4 TaxID=95605 RepID=UPI00034AC83D|nr:bifunctional ADP-dependent NAD(P)H-hydrate dehydratase/NAD(P)H-hydrate epimerase [Azospirillum sp. B4]